MKLFVLLSRVPYPLEKGDKLRAFHQIKALNQHHTVFLCCLNFGKLDPDAKNKLAEISSGYAIIQLSYFLLPFYLLFTLFGKKPLQVGYFFQWHAYAKVNRLIKTFQPDHIYCQLVRTAEYVKHLHHIPKTIDYQDAFSAGVARRESKSGLLTRPIWKMEKNRLRYYENIIFDYFDHRTIISSQDRDVIHHPKNKDIVIVPNGVDFDRFFPATGDKKTDLLFTGNMSYPPNVESVIYLVEKILPLVRQQYPEISLTICGANPTAKVMALSGNGVTVTGWVNDLVSVYQSSKIFIAPMQLGAGLQNKLLEAMACGIPCITSSLAANALHQLPEKPYLVGNSPAEYAKHIVNLLANSSAMEILGGAGRNYVKENYSWHNATQPLLEILNKNE